MRNATVPSDYAKTIVVQALAKDLAKLLKQRTDIDGKIDLVKAEMKRVQSG